MAESSAPAVVIAAKLSPELRGRLGEAYRIVEIEDLKAPTPGLKVAVTNSVTGLNGAQMALLPDLRLIACNGAGTDAIDLAEAARRGIAVDPSKDAVSRDTADYAIAMIFAVVRRVAEGDRFLRAGRWGPERMGPTPRISGMTVGVVGLGRIGKLVARGCEGFGMTVRYTGPSRKADVSWPYDPTPQALARNCDLLVLTLPGGAATRHTVNATVLEALGPRGYVINISRGSVVDEAALLDALGRGAIAGAGLDVFEGEPDINRAFAAFDNVVLTPHMAGVTSQARRDMAEYIRQSVDAYFAAGG